ncbi:MAG: hypothetical protein HC898_01785 [Phycisphaerales bacterium]|nr:hypothetical protein [Phycisphaerales bacterium]
MEGNDVGGQGLQQCLWNDHPQSLVPRPDVAVFRRHSKRRGAAAILAMMFLVIFGALATAMAIVAQGNLSTADSHLKINRTLAAAETGLNFVMYRLNKVTKGITTSSGLIDETNAPTLWNSVRASMLTSMAGEVHHLQAPYETGTTLVIGPVALEPFILPQNHQPGDPVPGVMTFTATLTPHPLTGENYNSDYYKREPYSSMSPAVSNTNKLDSTWIRIRVQASEGPYGQQVTRALQMDFRLEKKIKFAILSRSRVMIGRHVMIEGPIGSRFTETDLPNGHPVQMECDFRGLASALDTKLDEFINTLALNDQNSDNRLNLADSREVDNIVNPAQYDTNADGYIDDYDFFLAHFDVDKKGFVTAGDLDASNDIRAAQLLSLIDTFGDPTRSGYNDGIIDEYDRYTKIRGQIQILAGLAGWLNGAAGGALQPIFQGGVIPEGSEPPVVFEADDTSLYQFTPSDFNTGTFKNIATGDLIQQANAEALKHDPDNPESPKPLGTTVFEAVPYGSAHPYDYYQRPVFENMTFTNVRIPKGTNALFKNCKFVGCTFVETTSDNTDPNFNYAGMLEGDQTQKYPSMTAVVGGVDVSDTKALANNLRFDGCKFEGAVVSDVPGEFTHARNKLAFTGNTQFNIEDSVSLSDSEKQLYRRSTLLTPHYSVEMGTFIDPNNSNENVQLTGTIVAGVVDLRGNIKVEGTILTTFEPKSDTGPVIGDTSPQFNTTLGYFPSVSGDLEAELPTGGLGKVQVRYNPTIPMPDGITGPISMTPDYETYTETGAP